MFIIELLSFSGKWKRSMNTKARGEFITAEEAQSVVDSEECNQDNAGCHYRIAPIPTAPDPEVVKLVDKINRIQAILDES